MSASPQKKMKFSQNKAKYYGKTNKEQFLISGMQGFMATCNFREKDCVREAYNILNHYADEMIGPEQQTINSETLTVESTGDDIADQLEREVSEANSKQKLGKNRRFKSVDTGANNCIFIRSSAPLDLVELVSRILNDIRSTGEQKTRFLLRLLPIEAVCRINELNSVAGQLFDKHFLKEGSTFSIVFNRRLNNDVKRDKIIAELADLVQSKNDANRVDLKNPERTVVVEIIKGLVLLSVVPGYLKNKKYNLVELANAKKNEEKINEKSDLDSNEKPVSEEGEKPVSVEGEKLISGTNELEKTVENKEIEEQKIGNNENSKDDVQD